MTEQLRVFSYGGGVQSTAALVLAAQGKINFKTFVFANVGEDSENPYTIQYINTYAKPYAAQNHIWLHDIPRIITRGDDKGKVRTLYQEITRPEIRSVRIPVYMKDGPPGRRACTIDFKIRVIGRWMKKNGMSKENPGILGMGISTDEITRMRTKSSVENQIYEYPLIDLGISRKDCEQIIQDAGLPVPPKSSCWFCPFHSKAYWAELQQNDPEMFAKSVDLEHKLNDIREKLGKDEVYLSGFKIPLEDITDEMAIDTLNVDDLPCDTNYCFL